MSSRCRDKVRHRVRQEAEELLACACLDLLWHVVLALLQLTDNAATLERDAQHAEICAAQVECEEVASLIARHAFRHVCREHCQR